MKQNIGLFILYRFLVLPVALIVTVLLVLILIKSELTALYVFFVAAIAELAIWLVWLIIEIIKFRKGQLYNRQYANMAIIGAFAIIMLLVYQLCFADNFMFTEYSPDKQYRVDVYLQREPFGMSMPGQGGMGSKLVTIVLKNKYGITIGKAVGETLYNDVEIEWYDDYVSFARGHGIRYKDGKTDW